MDDKDITQEEKHQNFRKQLWCNVYTAYVGADNATKNDGAFIWADIALKRFDERFKLNNN